MLYISKCKLNFSFVKQKFLIMHQKTHFSGQKKSANKKISFLLTNYVVAFITKIM